MTDDFLAFFRHEATLPLFHGSSKGRIAVSSHPLLWQAGANKFLIRKMPPVRPFLDE
jgi:hypothetical protein